MPYHDHTDEDDEDPDYGDDEDEDEDDIGDESISLEDGRRVDAAMRPFLAYDRDQSLFVIKPQTLERLAEAHPDIDPDDTLGVWALPLHPSKGDIYHYVQPYLDGCVRQTVIAPIAPQCRKTRVSGWGATLPVFTPEEETICGHCRKIAFSDDTGVSVTRHLEHSLRRLTRTVTDPLTTIAVANTGFDAARVASETTAPAQLAAPFVPATRMGDVCACVECGMAGFSSAQISTYPNRFIPSQWSVEGNSQALRCDHCTMKHRRDNTLPAYGFVNHNTILVVNNEIHAYSRPTDPIHAIPRGMGDDGFVPYNDGYLLDTRFHTTPPPESLRRAKKEKIMKNEETSAAPTFKEKAIGQAKDLGSAVSSAGQMILVNQSGEVLLRMAARLAQKGGPMGEWITLMLSDDDGREGVKLFMAFLLHSVGTHAPLPKGGAALRKIGQIQIQTSTFVLGNKYMSILLQEMGELMALADQLPDVMDAALPGARPTVGTFHNETEAVPVR